MSNQINDSLSLFTSLARIIFFSLDKTIAFFTIKATYDDSKMFQCQVSDLNIKSISSVFQLLKIKTGDIGENG